MFLRPKSHKSTIQFILLFCLVGGTILTSFLVYRQDNRTTVQSSSPTESDDSLTLDPLIDPPPSFSYSYTPHDPIEITTDEDFTSANGVTSGSGTSIDPFIIEGWNITSSGVHGIFISATTKYFLIRNNFIDTGGVSNIHGIFITNVISGTAKIENNSCQNNYYGIYLASSNYNSLTDNNCSNNWDGIYLYSSSNNSLTNNTCNSNNWDGIYLYSSSNNSLTNNNCSNNENGIYLYSSSSYNSLMNNTCDSNGNYGIRLSSSSYNSLTNNICNSNNWDGIYLYSSDSNLLSWNLLFDNEYGVYLNANSDNNILHHNTFINNSNSPQAYDDGSNNQWFDTETNEGNYWSDYSETGPYQIAGSSRSNDPYPLGEIPVVAEFTPLKGYFFVLFTSFILLCHIRRRDIKAN
jgi:parallel beta-helix repeat protein